MISKFEAQSMQSVTEIPINNLPQRSQFGKLFINSSQFSDSGGSFIEILSGELLCWYALLQAPGHYSWEKLNFPFVTNIVRLL